MNFNTMSSSNLDQTSALCGACEFLTDVEEMITCSSCELTYHSRCVDNTAADTEWCCPEGCWNEEDKEAPANNNLDNSAEQAREQPDAATQTDCPVVGQTEEFDAERWIREKQREIEMELAERQAQIDRELREKGEKMAEAIRKVMRRQEANLELERKKKADHEKRISELESSFQRRSSFIDEQLELNKYGFKKFLQCPQIVDSTSEEEAEEEEMIECDESSSETSEDHDGGAESRAKLNKQDVSRTLYGLGQQGSGLEKAQLAAGGGLTRKSPCYPNDQKPLPKSYGAQQESSEACGVSDGQNPAKLRYRLKGAVQDTGHCPPHLSQPVIEKQRQVVDRPEPLQRSHPAANGKLATLPTFKSAANQLYERTKATDIPLVNPLAIEDPASVLPNEEKRLWATKKAKIKNFSSKNNSDMITGTSRRRQTEDADLCCREEDRSSLSRANQMQSRVRHDRQLRFCEGTEEMFDDKRTKIVASWNCGDNQKLEKRGQSDAGWEHYIQVVLPVVSTVRASTPTIFQMVSYQRYERNTVTLIGGAKVVRLDLGDVRGKLTRQRTAEASHVWPRFTRIKEWVSAAQHSSIVKADDGQLLELIGMLRWMLSTITNTGNHQEAPKAPDKPKKQRPMQESVANVQQDPTETDAASGSAHGRGPDEALQEVDRDHTRITAASSTNLKPVQQRNLLSAELDLKVQAEADDFHKWRNRRELTDEAKNHVPKNGGCDESGNKLHQSHSTPLRHPGVSLLAMKGCNVHDGFDDDEGGQKLQGNATNLPGSVAFSRVNARQQMDSAARECVRTGENAGSAFAVNINAVNRIVRGNLLGLDGAQRMTAGNSRTTNSSVVKSDRFAVDNNEQSQQPETADQLKQESRTAVLGVFGKSYEPDGPKDVTGWGVTTAEMGALPNGVAPAV